MISVMRRGRLASTMELTAQGMGLTTGASMSAFSKTFGGTFGILFAIFLFCALSIGGCLMVCGGIPLFMGHAVDQAREAQERAQRADPKGAAEIEGRERQEINAEVREQRRKIFGQPDVEPAGEVAAEEPHVSDVEGPESILQEDQERKAKEGQKAAEEAAEREAARSNEEKADRLLKQAQILIPQNKSAARRRLQEIVHKYPETKAAGEAKKLLK